MGSNDRITEPGFYEVSHPANTHMVESKQVPGEMHSVAYSDDGKRSGRGAVTFRRVDDAEVSRCGQQTGPMSAESLLAGILYEFLKPIARKVGQKAWAFAEEKGGELIDNVVMSRRKVRAQREAEPSAARPQQAKVEEEETHSAEEFLKEMRFTSGTSREASPEQLLEIDSAMLDKYWDKYLNARPRLRAHETVLRRSALARCLITMPLGSDPTCPGAERSLAILQEDPRLEDAENLERIVPLLLDDSLWSAIDSDDSELYIELDAEALNRAIRRCANDDESEEGGNCAVSESVPV